MRLMNSSILTTVFLSVILGVCKLDVAEYTSSEPVPEGVLADNEVRVRKESWLSRLPYWIPLWSIKLPEYIELNSNVRLSRVSIDEDVKILYPLLEKLVQLKLFRIFKVDLMQPCPFWAMSAVCSSPGACHVCECDENDIPVEWRLKPKQSLVERNHYTKDSAEPWRSIDSDPSADEFLFSVSDEPSDTAIFVDLSLNRPAFTGYKGGEVWHLIYKENCDKIRFKDVNCQQSKALARLISGMQTVIATLSSIYYYPKQSPQQFSKTMENIRESKIILDRKAHRAMYKSNIEFFRAKVSDFPDWIGNMYFTFAVVTNTLCRAKKILETCNCETENATEYLATREALDTLMKHKFLSCEENISKFPIFTSKHEIAIRQLANISKIINCVECEKCRLHGKIKILALQVALRAAGFDTQISRIERNELVALVNSIYFLAEGISVLHEFRRTWIILRVTWVLGFCLLMFFIATLCMKRPRSKAE